MRFTRPNINRLTKQWDAGQLKNCYLLLFSHIYGFQIVWVNEDGKTCLLNDVNSSLIEGYFIPLAVFETEDQARQHLKDYVKWSEVF